MQTTLRLFALAGILVGSSFLPGIALAAVDDAQCVSNTLPSAMLAGETRVVSILVKNTGTTTWSVPTLGTPGGYYLTLFPITGNGLSQASIPVPYTVQPGESATLTFTLTAPTTAGAYPASYKMLHDQVDWFGENCGPSAITVQPAPQTPVYTPIPTPPSVQWPVSSDTRRVWEQTGSSTPIEWETYPYDIVIKKITMTTDWKKGAVGDFCFAMYRTESPAYPALTGAYSEPFCTHLLQYGSDGVWQRVTDLSASPLYIPANTRIACNSSGGNAPANMGRRSCAMEFERYTEGAPRYRMLRIPYMDAMFAPTGDMFTPSWYHGTPQTPLKVVGAYMYDGVIGTYSACMQRTNGANGQLKEEKCFPTKTKTFTQNNEPAQYLPLNWTLPYPDLLTARCDVQGATDAWDCAFYAVTEIPSSLTKGPENIFADYGNVPQAQLENWCSYYIKNVATASQKTQICGYVSCTEAEQIKNCINAFKPASCMASNMCYANTTNTPTANTPTQTSGNSVQYPLTQSQAPATQSSAPRGDTGNTASSQDAAAPASTSQQSGQARASSACPVITMSLQYGARDAKTRWQVSELQRFLANYYGVSVGDLVTGYFGVKTRAYVLRFQKEFQIYPQSGVVGPLTQKQIKRVCGAL